MATGDCEPPCTERGQSPGNGMNDKKGTEMDIYRAAKCG